MVSLQTIGGYAVFFIALFFIYPGLKGRDRFLKVFYYSLIIPSLIFFIKVSLMQGFSVEVSNKCTYCSFYTHCFGPNTSPLLCKIGVEYFFILFQYTIITLAVFIIGTLIASLLSSIRAIIPLNLLTAICAGIFLPLCACAVFPLVKRDGMPEISQAITKDLLQRGINCYYDHSGAIGRRYRRQDEAGTPFCLTVDSQTLKDDTVTIRDRDSMRQERIPIRGIIEELKKRIDIF